MIPKLFGLIGKNIDYSFSKKYFTDKFVAESFLENEYKNFDISDITEFGTIIAANPNLKGLNVTVPYKQDIIPYLDKLSKNATKIGAVNVIKITKKGNLKGCNSDYYGFKKSLQPLLQPHHKKALILGTGGSAQAVAFALSRLGIFYCFVSRQKTLENTIKYSQIDQNTFQNFQIIINCTPLGTSPKIDEYPPIPYQFFTKNHIAFDLIYNPAETEFLKQAKASHAVTKNGYEMLVFQAEKAWKIWCQ